MFASKRFLVCPCSTQKPKQVRLQKLRAKIENSVEVSMVSFRRFRGFASVCALFLLAAAPLLGQFTASIQGVVQDQSGAGVAKASVQLVNVATGVVKQATTDTTGNYRFVSLAPANYKITVEAAGFSKAEANVQLLTEQNLNVPIALQVGSASESVT